MSDVPDGRQGSATLSVTRSGWLGSRRLLHLLGNARAQWPAGHVCQFRAHLGGRAVVRSRRPVALMGLHPERLNVRERSTSIFTQFGSLRLGGILEGEHAISVARENL